jgi:hypothetical protein
VKASRQTVRAEVAPAGVNSLTRMLTKRSRSRIVLGLMGVIVTKRGRSEPRDPTSLPRRPQSRRVVHMMWMPFSLGRPYCVVP